MKFKRFAPPPTHLKLGVRQGELGFGIMGCGFAELWFAELLYFPASLRCGLSFFGKIVGEPTYEPRGIKHLIGNLTPIPGTK